MRRVWACALACGISPAAWGSAETQALKAQAAKRARDGDRAAAADILQQAVSLDPDDLAAHDDLATFQIALGRLAEVIAQLEPVVSRHPDHARALYALAYCYRKTDKPAQAASAYVEYIKLRPEDPDPYYGYAQALRETGDLPGALRALRVYVGMEKRSDESRWTERAKAEIRDLEAAGVRAPPPVAAVGAPSAMDLERLRTDVRDRPDDAGGWEALVKALRAVGRVREADAAQRRLDRLTGKAAPPAARKAPPEQLDALMAMPDPRAERRAREEEKRMRAEEARQVRAEGRRQLENERLLRTEQKKHERAAARRKKEEAVAQRKAEQEEAAARKREEREARKAESARLEAAKAEDETAESRVVVVSTRLPVPDRPAERPGDLPPVSAVDVERLRTAVRDEPEDARSWWMLAAALRAGGREAEAGSAERRASRLPHAGGPAAARGNAQPVQEEAAALEETLRQQAVELIREGDRLFAVRRFADALVAFRQAAEADEGSAEAEYKAGLAAAELGRTGDAAAAFERALARDQGHAAARKHLEQLRR